MSEMVWDAWLKSSIDNLQQKNLLRTLHPFLTLKSSTRALLPQAELEAWALGGACSSTVASYSPAEDLKEVTLFSLNDYLGLASHPDVCAAAGRTAEQVGMGLRSSAIVAGYSALHRDLEQALARLKSTEECLLFPTGFAANMGVMSALASDPDVTIYSDELNHASIIDGARLALRSGGADPSEQSQRLQVYRHNDMGHLEQLLSAGPARGRKLVVTDSLFSMDGDFANMKALAALRQRYGFLLVLDEAHATLVCGDSGGGAAEAAGVAGSVDIHVGTLSKAFGALGGFVSCSQNAKALLMNRCRSFVYSTALPAPVVSAASMAITVSYRESWRRHHLWSLVERLGDGLGVTATSPILPIVVGSEAEALRLSGKLLLRGMHAPAIRPPTVPQGTCRLRISLSAAHTYADVDTLIAALQEERVQSLPLLHLQVEQNTQVAPGIFCKL